MVRGVSGTPEVFASFRSQSDERHYLTILRGHLSAPQGRYIVGPRDTDLACQRETAWKIWILSMQIIQSLLLHRPARYGITAGA